MSSLSNPLLAPWTARHGVPPFSLIKTSHFEEAFEVAMKEQLAVLDEIANTSEVTFENTIAKFDRSGLLMSKVGGVYYNYTESLLTPELQEVQTKLATVLAAHENNVYMYPNLYSKFVEIYEKRESQNYSHEQIRLIERFYLDFRRHGAAFDAETQKEYAKITEKLAELETKFVQNTMADENNYIITLKKEDLIGLPDSIISAARETAKERNLPDDDYVITLSRSLVEPFITYSDRRDLRERAWKAWTCRGELEESRSNNPVITEILKLRKRQAELHNYENFSYYQTADTMAGTPQKVMELLEEVWNKGKDSISREREALMEYVATTGADIDKIQPWDWRYYAEKVRSSKYDLDQSEIKAYFSLDAMVEAIFDCAYQLFGLKYKLAADIEPYHPDVKGM